MRMPLSSLIQPLAGSLLGRRLGDKCFVSFARRRMAELDHLDIDRVQEQTLQRLIRQAQHTRFGRDHDFARIRTPRDYRRLVPLRTYEDFWRDYWQPVYPRLQGATWPEAIPYIALSSGTTSGTTKHIPVSPAMLHSNRRAALTMLSSFAAVNPRANLFHGQLFFLGGSTDLAAVGPDCQAGDLSAIAALNVPSYLRPMTFPPPRVALLTDWEEKLDRLAEASLSLPITLLGGVPSWLLILMQRLKQRSGKATLAEIWPALRVVVVGGIKFDPYRELFRQQLGSSQIRCLETYPASEGFIAFEDPRHDLLRVIPDHHLYLEFVPVAELDQPQPTRHGLAEVERGVQYAVVLTTCAGLWSYVIGDTVAFERTDPPLLRFTGRTKYFLSAFGEHLISEEVEKALTLACQAAGAQLTDYHVGPIFPDQSQPLGYHLYLIEFAKPPADQGAFTQRLDQALCDLNEDYRAHRRGDTSLLAPKVRVIQPGGVMAWMKAHGKLGGQHKLPRMDNTGQRTAALAEWFDEKGY